MTTPDNRVREPELVEGPTGIFRFDPTKPEGEQYTLEDDRGAARETPDLPPVGATVTDADGNVYQVALNALGDSRWTGVYSGGRLVGVGSMSTILTALWRAEQRIKELELVEAEWRAAAADASLPGTGSPNLSNPRGWARQQVALAVTLCEDRARYKAELEKANAEIVDLHALLLVAQR